MKTFPMSPRLAGGDPAGLRGWAEAGREGLCRMLRAVLRALDGGLNASHPHLAPVTCDQTRPVPGGLISLVGAGPGAADLLTLRALRCLQRADVIFYDRLVDPEVLAHARPGGERIYVGKAVGACDWPQERIDAVIVAAALQGKRVVRLKSGDPGIFGRATEELAAARRHGIPTEIVPGVTAASAAGAALGRALTERGETDRLVLATGTCRPGDDAPDWGAMLMPGTTLALYMGVSQAARIEANLRAAGVPDRASVEIVSHASGRDQRIVTCCLGTLARTVRSRGVENPAIIVIRHPKGELSCSALHPLRRVG